MAGRSTEELDVAIVGGGVAGVYAAWRIVKDGPGTKLWDGAGGKPQVGIFEYSNRIGGRLLSMELPGIAQRKIELGGMRYLTSHWRVRALTSRFGLQTRPLNVVDPGKSNIYYLRGRHFTAADWDQPAFEPPYRLDRGEQGRSPGELLVEVCLKYRHQADQLRNVGFWNLLLDEYSLEAYQLMRDAGGYESIVGNWSAAEAIPFLLADFDPKLTYRAFNDGFQSIPLRLAAEAKAADVQIRPQHRLHRLDLEDDGLVRLTFDTDPASFRTRRLRQEASKTVRARHVILALPRRSIELLHQDSFLFAQAQFQDDLQTILAQPAFKIFAAYRRPWWQERNLISGRSVTDLPVRQCYYWLPDEDVRQAGGRPREVNSILMASYNDSSSVQFWGGLARDAARYEPSPFAVPPGVPIPDPVRDRSASAVMVAELQDQLRELHGLGDVRDPATAQMIPPYAAVYQDWTQEPFGGGWHFWKIGVNARQVGERMRRPIADAPVYICGEAWSRQQGWVEGALETTDDLLQTEFGLPALEQPPEPAAPAFAAPAPDHRTYWSEARQR